MGWAWWQQEQGAADPPGAAEQWLQQGLCGKCDWAAGIWGCGRARSTGMQCGKDSHCKVTITRPDELEIQFL